MACKDVNKTPDEIRNIFINKGMFWDLSPDDTLEDVLARLDFFNKMLILPEGENQKYRMAGWEVRDRVSNLAKREYESRVGKSAVQREVNKSDFVKQRHAGTRIHAILAELMDHLYNGIGNLEDIKARASKGDYAISGNNFLALVKLVREHIREINRVQDSIDKTKKAVVRVEQKMVSAKRNIGGALDILVVFSDKTHARIDYKTASHKSWNYDYQSGQLSDDLLEMNKVNDYSLSMAEYGRILKEAGLGAERMVRLSPIHVEFAYKDVKERNVDAFDTLTTNILRVEAGSGMSQYLKPIPIAGEKTEYTGIDALLDKQWGLLGRLSERLNNKKLNASEKDDIRRQIKSLRKAIQKTIIDGDISDIIKTARLLSNEMSKRIAEPKEVDGNENAKYLSDIELEDLIDELSLYKDIVENTHTYYNDLKKADPKKFEELRSKIADVHLLIDDTLAEAKIHREQRMLNYFGNQYKDAKGNLLPLEELDFFTRNFTRFSEIDHPIFKVAWGMIQDSYFHMRQEIVKLDHELKSVEEGVFRWAKQNGVSRLDALKMIVDMDKGHLISQLSPELQKRISNAYSEPDISRAAKMLRDIYEIRDLKDYKENYAARFERFQQTESLKYEQGENDPQYQRALQNWINNNDLLNSDKAWITDYNKNWWLSLKTEVREANLSNEYKKIKGIKPLLDYYEFYVKKNNELRKMLGVSGKDLPYNFIANVRKSMVDSLSMDKFNIAAAGREFFDSLQVRDEDVFLTDVDSNGNLRRSIPILFLNPFKNADGEIDNTIKSYDLSKNLLLFAKMAMNHKYMSEIEPKILQMRHYMADPTSEREGTKVTTKTGKGFKGLTKEWATKKGLDTDTYRLFEELTDFYLYGIKFKDSSLKGNKIDTTKMLLKMKQYYGKSALAFAVIPAFGAWFAGSTARALEGIKGISYNKKHWAQAGFHMNTPANHSKYTALALYYDVYAEDPLTKLVENRSANFWSKIMTYRNMMYPLRRADELINNQILNAMALNWGIDIDGKLGKKGALVRLNMPGIKTEGIKNIWDLTTFDKETGKVRIEGLTDENYIAFRNAVKSTSANVIGSLSVEDISRIDTNLLYNIMFQFKSWMPGVVRERSGKLIYDDKIQAARWGRYRAAFAEFNPSLTKTDMDDAFKLKKYISDVVLPNVAKFTLDLATFGLSPKIGLGSNTYVDAEGKERRVRTNPERARRLYIKYLEEHPELANKMTFEMFLEVKEAQMRAFTNEVRAILMFAMVISVLGGDGDGEEPPYMANWFSRFMYKNITKAQSELLFPWSPIQLTQLIKNPIPMVGLLNRTINTGMNGFDETRDMLFGENSMNDKTPFPYYLLQWVYGGSQIARFGEFYSQYEKSNYLNTNTSY